MGRFRGRRANYWTLIDSMLPGRQYRRIGAKAATCKVDAGAEGTWKAIMEPAPASKGVLPRDSEAHFADKAAAYKHQAGRCAWRGYLEQAPASRNMEPREMRGHTAKKVALCKHQARETRLERVSGAGP